MPDTRGKYFSVKYSTRIQGAHYIPSVCYPLSSGLQAVIEEMAAKDMARIYPEKVRFVTGVPYPVKKPETGASALRPSAVSAPQAEAGNPAAPAAGRIPGGLEKQGRKSGRSAFTSQRGREFD
jgi:hypothetical protein